MTKESMDLRNLVEKASDRDLLRDMIGFTAERPMWARECMRLASSGLNGILSSICSDFGYQPEKASKFLRGRNEYI